MFVLFFVLSASLLKVLTRCDFCLKLQAERIYYLIQYSVCAKKNQCKITPVIPVRNRVSHQVEHEDLVWINCAYYVDLHFQELGRKELWFNHSW